MSVARVSGAIAGGLLLFGAAFAASDAQNVDAPHFDGDAGGSHFSNLTQINAENVNQLQQVWRYDVASPGDVENTPIMVGGVLYGTAGGKVFALDAVTGVEKWTFAPPATARGATRGESWWTDGKQSRLLVTAGNLVFSIDPSSGQPDPNFGKGGSIDLNDNLRGAAADNSVHMGGAVNVYKNLFFTCGGVSERTPASPGDIRAWDVKTGKLVWTFHTIPHPGEKNADSWPADGYLKGGGNNDWVGMVLDEKRGILFAGTGSPADDYYGGERPGKNLYGDSVLAINAKTGKLIWYYQAVHHDLWDADFAAPPILMTVKRNGKMIDAVAATNKTGFVYVFNRLTGKPVFPIDELPVPATNLPGDTASPTQPHPQLPPPLSRQTLTADELTQRSPEANAWAREKFATFVSGPHFTPPAYNQETVVAPGFSGGNEWGGMTFDPKRQLLFANTENIVWTTAVTDYKPPVGVPETFPHSRYSFSGYHKFYDQDGYPATAAPWGHLTAIDLNTGKFAWRIPFGEYPELAAKGLTNTGSENYGGAVATASGLLFIGATIYDQKLHAYDSSTGKLLWETVLPYSGVATPLTYMSGGRQFVVIAASGGRNRKGPRGSAYVAYALAK